MVRSSVLRLFFSAHIWLRSLLQRAPTYRAIGEALHVSADRLVGLFPPASFTVYVIYWSHKVFLLDVKSGYNCGGYLGFNYSFPFILLS